MAMIHCHSNYLMPSLALCYVIHDFIGIFTSFFRDSSLISKILINNCETKNQILYNIVIVHCHSIHLIAILAV